MHLPLERKSAGSAALPDFKHYSVTVRRTAITPLQRRRRCFLLAKKICG